MNSPRCGIADAYFIPASTERTEPPLIDSVTISDPRYALVHGLRVGLPRAAFIEQLGEPDAETDHAMSYGDSEAYEIGIEFDAAGNVNRIRWQRGGD